ncbi:right-handed parallel beta-helix repeat-containing protein [Clostridium grantii]|uniref:Right handed beta helix domain-containing protein n=1 Tax=Clostridium grantii DSM 8605 TaxID=1121316 RepID=A0A1M5V710_9CLOT|nr:right-handed parallel beta-helix repeat-containing protein [Clostridium grantii]SHH71005.1 hypothetical protein SAMN02745207_02134 [Clostridium grantii DSM 8605]
MLYLSYELYNTSYKGGEIISNLNFKTKSLKLKKTSMKNPLVIVNDVKKLQSALNSHRFIIIFIKKGHYNLIDKKVIVKNKNKFIFGGEGVIFLSGLEIITSCFINHITFIIKNNDSNVFLSNSSYVLFKNCKFIGFNDTKSDAIYIEEDSNCTINLISCSFTLLKTGLVLNSNNTLGSIIKNRFDHLSIGISNIQHGSTIQDIFKIKHNLFKSIKNYAIDFSTGTKILENTKLTLLSNGSDFSRTLCLNNNLAYIKGLGEFEEINTKFYKVNNSDELKTTLLNCSSGNILYLMKGFYFGDFTIQKEISLLGEDMNQTIIVPQVKNNSNTPQYGIRILSSNVIIMNLSIDGKGNKLLRDTCNFRDGIRYEYFNGTNNVFSNILIKNVLRRGISIWPKAENTTISNCKIFDVCQNQGIYFSGSGVIEKCYLNNMKIGIEINDSSFINELYIINNTLCNHNLGIIVSYYLKNTFFSNNFFHNVKIAIDTKES